MTSLIVGQSMGILTSDAVPPPFPLESDVVFFVFPALENAGGFL